MQKTPSSSILELSHTINADLNPADPSSSHDSGFIPLSFDPLPSPKSTSHKKGRPKKAVPLANDATAPPEPIRRNPTPPPPPASSPFDSFFQSSTPKPAPPKKSATIADPTAAKALAANREKAEDERRLLEKKICMYRVNPRMRTMLGDLEIPYDLSGHSMPAIRRLYQDIQDQLNIHFREQYVEGFFRMGMDGIEKGCEFFMQGVEWKGMAEMACDPEHIETFQPELSQIAVELSDSMIPGPKLRLGMKVLQFVKAFYEERKLVEYKMQQKEQHKQQQ